MSSAKRADPVTFVRSPIMRKFESGRSVSGSRPLQCARPSGAGGVRGGSGRTASAIARMCSGVVPQQPPTKFTRFDSANSRSNAAVSAATSS